jgi:hypothetical protein
VLTLDHARSIKLLRRCISRVLRRAAAPEPTLTKLFHASATSQRWCSGELHPLPGVRSGLSGNGRDAGIFPRDNSDRHPQTCTPSGTLVANCPIFPRENSL